MVDSSPESEKGERIAKRLARAGVCSRRDAEKLIAEGRVVVDGHKLSTPATLVTDSAIITVDGKVVGAPERTRVWRYHKPRSLLTTNRDPQGRATSPATTSGSWRARNCTASSAPTGWQ